MKQKYILIRDDKNNKFIIQEYSEIDGEIKSMLCEEIYKLDNLKNLIKEPDVLLKKLRTNNIYPPSIYMTRILDSVLDMLNKKDNKSIELQFNDKEMNSKEALTNQEITNDNIIKKESVDIDNILEENFKEEINSTLSENNKIEKNK